MNRKSSPDQLFDALDRHLVDKERHASSHDSDGILKGMDDLIPVLGLKKGYEFRDKAEETGEEYRKNRLPSLERRLAESRQIAYDSLLSHQQNNSAGRFSHILNFAPVRIVAMLVVLLLAVGIVRESLTTAVSDNFVTYSTRNGEVGVVTLADGTEVTLNAASRLSVSDNYSTRIRDVDLTGEAVFKVMGKGSAPFTVTTSNSSIKVLGTEFVVRKYVDDPSTHLSVYSGRVAIGDVVAGRGQRVLVTESGTTRLSSFDYESDSSMIAFRSRVLQLRDIKISNAVGSLERWYNATIEFDNKDWLNLEMSGDFNLGTREELIEVFTNMLDAKALVRGDTITFIKGR